MILRDPELLASSAANGLKAIRDQDPISDESYPKRYYDGIQQFARSAHTDDGTHGPNGNYNRHVEEGSEFGKSAKIHEVKGQKETDILAHERKNAQRMKDEAAHDRRSSNEKALRERTEIEFFEREKVIEKHKHHVDGDYHHNNYDTIGSSSSDRKVYTNSRPYKNLHQSAAKEQLKPSSSSFDPTSDDPDEDKHLGKVTGWKESGYKIVSEVEYVDKDAQQDKGYKTRDKGQAEHVKDRQEKTRAADHHVADVLHPESQPQDVSSHAEPTGPILDPHQNPPQVFYHFIQDPHQHAALSSSENKLAVKVTSPTLISAVNESKPGDGPSYTRQAQVDAISWNTTLLKPTVGRLKELLDSSASSSRSVTMSKPSVTPANYITTNVQFVPKEYNALHIIDSPQLGSSGPLMASSSVSNVQHATPEAPTDTTKYYTQPQVTKAAEDAAAFHKFMSDKKMFESLTPSLLAVNLGSDPKSQSASEADKMRFSKLVSVQKDPSVVEPHPSKPPYLTQSAAYAIATGHEHAPSQHLQRRPQSVDEMIKVVPFPLKSFPLQSADESKVSQSMPVATPASFTTAVRVGSPLGNMMSGQQTHGPKVNEYLVQNSNNIIKLEPLPSSANAVPIQIKPYQKNMFWNQKQFEQNQEQKQSSESGFMQQSGSSSSSSVGGKPPQGPQGPSSLSAMTMLTGYTPIPGPAPTPKSMPVATPSPYLIQYHNKLMAELVQQKMKNQKAPQSSGPNGLKVSGTSSQTSSTGPQLTPAQQKQKLFELSDFLLKYQPSLFNQPKPQMNQQASHQSNQQQQQPWAQFNNLINADQTNQLHQIPAQQTINFEPLQQSQQQNNFQQQQQNPMMGMQMGNNPFQQVPSGPPASGLQKIPQQLKDFAASLSGYPLAAFGSLGQQLTGSASADSSKKQQQPQFSQQFQTSQKLPSVPSGVVFGTQTYLPPPMPTQRASITENAQKQLSRLRNAFALPRLSQLSPFSRGLTPSSSSAQPASQGSPFSVSPAMFESLAFSSPGGMMASESSENKVFTPKKGQIQFGFSQNDEDDGEAFVPSNPNGPVYSPLASVTKSDISRNDGQPDDEDEDDDDGNDADDDKKYQPTDSKEVHNYHDDMDDDEMKTYQHLYYNHDDQKLDDKKLFSQPLKHDNSSRNSVPEASGHGRGPSEVKVASIESTQDHKSFQELVQKSKSNSSEATTESLNQILPTPKYDDEEDDITKPYNNDINPNANQSVLSNDNQINKKFSQPLILKHLTPHKSLVDAIVKSMWVASDFVPYLTTQG